MTAATKLFVSLSTLAFLIVGVIGTTFAGEGVSSDVRSEPPFPTPRGQVEDSPAPFLLTDRGEARLGVCVPVLDPAGDVATSRPSRPDCGGALDAPAFNE